MELVLGTQQLTGSGSPEPYLTTVAEQLQALGHEVTVHVGEPGPGIEPARRRGLRVANGLHDLPGRCDAVLAHDAAAAYQLADLYPGVGQVFVMGSDRSPGGVPPQLDGVTSAVVALSARAEQAARALARRPEPVRLTQPVDTQRLVPDGPMHDEPRRVLIAGDRIRGARRRLLLETCAELGLQCVASSEEAGVEAEPAIGDVDVVVGEGRAIVEAMARGRAAYVLGADGCNGWVTAERYPALEADGFAGQADPVTTVGRDRLRRDLAEYRAEMGLVNRDLAAAHHSAHAHAERLVELLGREAESHGNEDGRLHEMARLVRSNWALESSLEDMRGRLEALGAQLAQAEHNLANAMEIVRAHDEFIATRRYRAARAMGRPADRLRRALRRGHDG